MREPPADAAPPRDPVDRADSTARVVEKPPLVRGPDAREPPSFNWGLFRSTVLVLGGGLAFILGATEIGVVVVAPEEGGSVLRGLVLLVAGLVVAGWPIVTGIREVVGVRAREASRDAEE